MSLWISFVLFVFITRCSLVQRLNDVVSLFYFLVRKLAQIPIHNSLFIDSPNFRLKKFQMIAHLKLAGNVHSSFFFGYSFVDSMFRFANLSIFYLTCNHWIFPLESPAETIFQRFQWKSTKFTCDNSHLDLYTIRVCSINSL